jgi:starch synthase (maltosyl-transferring)
MEKPANNKVRRRVVIELVIPEVNGGRFPIKRVTGEWIEVEADIYADGHDELNARLLWRKRGSDAWSSSPMTSHVNDRWTGRFQVTETGAYEFTLEGWVDNFATWQSQFERRVIAGQDLGIELLIGSDLLRTVADRAAGNDRERLLQISQELRQGESVASRSKLALDEKLLEIARRYPENENSTLYKTVLPVWVDRPRARYGSWYEMFPRSASNEPGRHGTFRDVVERLPYLVELGVDVLYLPPIHPIGTTYRKGRNNALVASPDDPGSPWGIGSDQGGHKSIHPELGTLQDFRDLVAAANREGIEIALDIALQCSPDHPYVTEHRDWFKERPDGTIQYAENPPKKYQDIYPLDFDCADWRNLWEEILSVFLYWIEQGVNIFRVDNPHTKPFRFWEWLIWEVKSRHPDVLFLAEAFTRPKIMHRLAKIGFSQSYTYFTWRNNKWEIEQYLNELTHDASREYFVPNLWPNTPDILHEFLQTGGRPAFIARLCLAGMAGANYGIYGPVYEQLHNVPRERGIEENINSEKYEIKHWDLDDPKSIRDMVRRVNLARRNNVALQSDWSLRLHRIDNPFLLLFSKSTPDFSNVVITVINLDPFNTQIGWTDFSPADFGLEWDEHYQVEDLLTDRIFEWHGGRNYIELDPSQLPAHIFTLKRIPVEPVG